jgi:hypothetical protein
MTDFHLLVQPNGGRDAPNAGIGTGPYRGAGFELTPARQSEQRWPRWLKIKCESLTALTNPRRTMKPRTEGLSRKFEAP